MSDTDKRYLTPREAHAVAQERGIKINPDTVRRLARRHGLALRCGHKLFVDRDGWLRYLDTGEPDKLPPRLAQQIQRSTSA